LSFEARPFPPGAAAADRSPRSAKKVSFAAGGSRVAAGPNAVAVGARANQIAAEVQHKVRELRPAGMGVATFRNKCLTTVFCCKK